MVSLPLGSTFFGLTLEYRQNLLQQIYYLVKHLGFGYFEALNIPVYERRVYLDMFKKEMEEEQKQYKKAQSRKR